MHPRNVCNEPVDYVKFASKYEFFKPYVKTNARNRRLMVDFKDDDAIRALNRCILLEHFQLDIDIPKFCLIPRIPLRLNYLLWLEDLLTENGGFSNGKADRKSSICGLDIGTGPCAIYAVLAAKNWGWKMVGTEINGRSVEIALENIKKNNLKDSISIVKVEGVNMFEPVKDFTCKKFDFSMCNPPFFSHCEDALLKNETPTYWTEKSSLDNEIICEGGEVEFIRKMFQESSRCRIARIFTTMVGVKKHLIVILKGMKDANFNNYTTTSFHQGNNHRWGLAWSWDESVKFKKPEKFKVKKAKRSTLYLELPMFVTRDDSLTQVLKVFKDLRLGVTAHENGYKVKATENTWIHRRRKRRLRLQQQDTAADSTDQIPEPKSKVLRLDECSSVSTLCANRTDSSIEQDKISTEAILEFNASVDYQDTIANKNPVLRLEYLGGVLGIDGVQQIIQYLKNCLHPSTQA